MKKYIVIAVTALALGLPAFHYSQAADEMKGDEMMMKEMQMMEQMNTKMQEIDAKVTKILTLMQEKGMMEKGGEMMEEEGGEMKK